MRCDEVIRELATPSGVCDEAALARHLAQCPSCAGWAERSARLDRLWDLTRPVEPSPQVWENLWDQVTARLDQDANHDRTASPVDRGTRVATQAGSVSKILTLSPPHQLHGRSRPWRVLAAIGMIGLAQAAALLIAIGLYWQKSGQLDQASPALHSAGSTSVVVSAPGAASPMTTTEVDVEEGQLVLIRAQESGVEVVDLIARDTPYGFDAWYVVYNVFESMANPVVAMTE